MDIFYILCFCLVILVLFYSYLTVNFDYWKSYGVKGPKPIPFFGTIVKVFFNRLCFGDYLKEIYDKYPKETMVGIFVRAQPSLLLKDPEIIKKVLIKDFSDFPDREFNVYEKAEPLSLNLINLNAARWRPLRTRFSPVFTSGKLKDMFHLLLECSEHFESYLNKIIPKDGIIECKDLTSKFTIDVIGLCGFGLEMKALSEENNKFYRVGHKIFRPNLRKIMRSLFQRIWPWLYNQIGSILNDDDITNTITNMIVDTIKYRKENNVMKNDFVQVLIDLKDHAEKLDLGDALDTYVAAQAFVFFAAGFETSSTVMSNTLYELAQLPSIQEKLRTEIKEVLDSTGGALSYENIKKMTYLQKVFQESLRKYPAVMYLSRKAERNYTFENTKVTLQKGMKVYIPVYAIQRDADIYPDPERFDPERFSDENVQSRHSMHYLPFGDGPRKCIAERFAHYQSKIGLIKIVMNYKIDVCEKTQIPYMNNRKPSVVLQPRHGLYVKLIKLT